jgi:replicative DNA helicase
MTDGRTQALPVLFFSLEMSKEQLATRLLCAEARMDASVIKRGGLSPNQWGQLMNAAERIRQLPILVDDTSSLTMLDVRTRATRLHMDGGLAMLVIDYLQLLTPARRLNNRQQEISEISRELKILAKELHIPILALSQLNRAVEQRSEHKPVLSDIRESGAVEQDADVVMFIYREKEESSQTAGHAQLVTLDIAKQRNGPVGEINLIFHKAYARFDAAAASHLHGGPVF